MNETIVATSAAAGHLTVLEIVAFFCTWAGGVLVNYVNKSARERLGWKQYWTRNPLTTVASLVVSFGLCISLLLSEETNHLTYFSVAFMAENLINSRGQGDGKGKSDDDSDEDTSTSSKRTRRDPEPDSAPEDASKPDTQPKQS